MSRYTIDVIKTNEDLLEVSDFILEVSARLSQTYGDKFNWTNFRFHPQHRITVCRRDGKPVGFMLALLTSSTFDPETKLYVQETIYAVPGTRAAWHLMQDFIDFGRKNAKHVITMIGRESDIKSRTLELLGFKELETLYRMEV